MNYDVVSSIINHGITNCMQVEAANFPLLMVENKFSSKEDKYKVRFRSMSLPYPGVEKYNMCLLFTAHGDVL